MPVTVSVLYPNEPDAKYDIDYYINTHMPLAASTWKDAGVKSWSVHKYLPGPGGQESKYVFAGVLEFESVEAVHKALASPDSKTVTDDVPNFSNKQPTFLIGEHAATA
ncbi:hypothetical protein CCHL11_08062 [Colletotrichum chlorophyti]|uniref:EthD domain-containing protein n=1 Tax=Colletotrichum chlorophyti TaxID=708187 RepID=A0A1Q8RMC8_9PEZI|nr:hypothetical protein CCHL11_08062 [Colletotrichum chlorophyti]